MSMFDSDPVLLVEDEVNDAYLVQTAFEAAKIASPLIVVDSGNKAIDYLSGRGQFADRSRCPIPRLILLDLNLPGASGFEVLEWIRAHAELSLLNVVILSSSRLDTDVKEAYRKGANGYLVKPDGMPALLEMIRAIDAFWLRHNRQITLKLWEFSGLAEKRRANGVTEAR